MWGGTKHELPEKRLRVRLGEGKQGSGELSTVYEHPVDTNTFYGLLSVLINRVWLYLFLQSSHHTNLKFFVTIKLYLSLEPIWTLMRRKRKLLHCKTFNWCLVDVDCSDITASHVNIYFHLRNNNRKTSEWLHSTSGERPILKHCIYSIKRCRRNQKKLLSNKRRTESEECGDNSRRKLGNQVYYFWGLTNVILKDNGRLRINTVSETLKILFYQICTVGLQWESFIKQGHGRNINP